MELCLHQKKNSKNPKAQNLLWNIQRLKDPIQSLWNNRRHFAERDTIMSKALWIGISNFRYHIVTSRSTCYYSGNQKFCFLKSRLVTCRTFLLGTKPFFVFQDRKLKFLASYWYRISWILTKFQLIRITFIFRAHVKFN